MVHRYHQEVDPHRAFLCGHHQTPSKSSREPTMAQHIGDWEKNWNRLARERGPRSGSSPGNESSPRWDSSFREEHNGHRNTSHNGGGGSRRDFSGSTFHGDRNSHEANIFQGGGGRQEEDSYEGRVSSLQADGSCQGGVTALRDCRVMPRQSRSV